MSAMPMYVVIIAVLGLVVWRRTRAMVRPMKGSGIKQLLPIIYLVPLFYVLSQTQLHLNVWEIGIASATGVLLAVPLILTTNYEIREDGQIYAQKSKAFFIALFSVLVLRIALRQFISGLDPASLAMLFFIVAFSYVVPWRIASFVKFRMVKQSQGLDNVLVPVKA